MRGYSFFIRHFLKLGTLSHEESPEATKSEILLANTPVISQTTLV